MKIKKNLRFVPNRFYNTQIKYDAFNNWLSVIPLFKIKPASLLTRYLYHNLIEQYIFTKNHIFWN